MALSTVPSLPLVDVNTAKTEEWGYTQIKYEKFSYTWTIENFSLLNEETAKYLDSSEFSADAKNDYKLNLRIYPKGNNIDHKEYLSIFLNVRSCHKSTAQCKYKLAILNSKNEQINSQSSEEINQFTINKQWGYSSFIRRDLLLKESNLYLPKDTLTILCEGVVLTDRVNTSGQGHRSNITVPDCKLSEDLGNLIANENFSDVILEVGGHEIKAHKAILSSRSNVFAAMFKQNLEENKSNRVIVTDIDHEVLKEMLCFIYTGKASELKKNAKDLFAAADKYALERLKVICEIVLLESLSAETAAETFILAYLHNSVQMKAETINYIKSNITDIMKTKGWLDMMTSYPDLVAEIIESLVKK